MTQRVHHLRRVAVVVCLTAVLGVGVVAGTSETRSGRTSPTARVPEYAGPPLHPVAEATLHATAWKAVARTPLPNRPSGRSDEPIREAFPLSEGHPRGRRRPLPRTDANAVGVASVHGVDAQQALSSTPPEVVVLLDPQPDAPPANAQAAAQTTNLTPDPCAHTHNHPECGTGHWEPPVQNQPATLHLVAISPPAPRVGQRVTYTFQWSDPDADTPFPAFADGQSSVIGGSPANTGTSCKPTGAWSPPPAHGATATIVARTRYTSSGTYRWRISIRSASADYAWALDGYVPCALPDPYASSAQLAGRTVVS